jgi:glutamate dehydrogenase/leucine dehydrogenase
MNLDEILRLLEADYPEKKRLHKAINILKRPQNILKKKLILKLSTGKKKVFQSYRVENNDARGPFLGGTTYSSNLSEDYLKEFSLEESIKSALVDIPFGGALGGIDIDAKKTNMKDLERVTKLYSQFLSKSIGPWKDILSTNMGTTEQTQFWMMESYEKRKRFHSPATFVTNNNSLDGAVYVLQEYLKNSNLASRFRKLDIAVCGFGKRASLFLKNLNKQNFRIVAISDKSGGIINSNGFEIEEIKDLKTKFGTLKEVSVMTNKEYLTNEKLLELPVDILVVAADLVEKKTDFNINAKLVLELGKLDKNKDGNFVILPNILLNSGFSVLNHLDWIQRMHGYRWSREEVNKKLQNSIIKTFNEVKNIMEEKKIDYKEASYYIGIKRIADAMMSRGRV